MDVDPEVLVGDQIAQSGDVGPGNLGRPLARLGAQVLGGLADTTNWKRRASWSSGSFSRRGVVGIVQVPVESQRSRPRCRADAPASPGSQGQGLVEHLAADALLQHVGRCDVNWQIEDLSRLTAKGGEVDKGVARLEVDEEVDVAPGLRFAAGERSKYTQLPNAVLVGGIEQKAAFPAQLFRLMSELTSY